MHQLDYYYQILIFLHSSFPSVTKSHSDFLVQIDNCMDDRKDSTEGKNWVQKDTKTLSSICILTNIYLLMGMEHPQANPWGGVMQITDQEPEE